MRAPYVAAFILAIVAPTRTLADAQFQLLTVGTGFRDATPVAPIGGNAGKTLGEQRRLALERALAIWGEQLDSSIPVIVRASFEPLECEPRAAVLAQAGALRYMCETDAPPGTPAFCYPGALANRLAAEELTPGLPDVLIEFNSSIDGACGARFGGGWYYGLEPSERSAGNDLIEIALHELAHGLGFASTVDPETGELALPQVDPFSAHIHDLDLGRTWDELSEAERVRSATNQRRVVWDGPAAQRESAHFLVASPGVGSADGREKQRRGTDELGRPLLFTPSPVAPGSSVSHFDPSAAPDLLMEPSYSGRPRRQLDLTLAVLRDLGWTPFCGNGELDGGEQCDDGASNDDDASDRCRSTCLPAHCGDGVVDTGERCDQGEENSDARADACRLDCQPARCGDGVVDSGELCDAAAANSDAVRDACRSDCRPAHCGDGVLDTGEACDGGEDCTPSCTLYEARAPFPPWKLMTPERDQTPAPPGCTVSGSRRERSAVWSWLVLAGGCGLFRRSRRRSAGAAGKK